MRCLSAPDLVGAEGRRSLATLKKFADVALGSLLTRLATAGDAEATRIREIMIYLLDNESITAYVKGLYSQVHPRVLNTTIRVLSQSTTYNPNQLLALFDNPDVAKSALLKVLEARKDSLNPAALLRKAYTLDPAERVAMFKVLEDISDESMVPELVNRVTAQDVNTRLGMVRLLRKFNTPMSRSALMNRLTDASKEVRFVALDALASMNVNIDVGVLCKLLRDDDYNVQNRSIDAIVKRNDPVTIRYLVALLKDESEYIRRAAVEVLNGMEYPDAVNDLLQALKDEDWWVRARAADALAKIGGKRVVEAVIKLLKSEDEYLRRSAIEVLNSTKDDASMEHLIGALNDSDWWVRERAIDALASIGNKASIPSLLRLMRDDNQAAPIVLRAMKVLADESHVKSIISMLGSQDENIVIETVRTLAEIVDTPQAERVVKAMKRRAMAGNEEIRDATREALKRINARLAVAVRRPQPEALAAPGAVAAPAMAASSRHIDVKALKPGDKLSDRYEFVRRVGKGAFSTVLLVKDVVVGERIILKVLHEKMTADQAMIKRFIREIRYSRRIMHPNVIRIFDFLTIDKLHAISMEYFPSVTLSALLEPKQPLDSARALRLAADVAAGIDAAHQLGIIHRDLKPGNVLLNKDDWVKIVDFGISRLQSSSDTQLTRAGILIGTPRYMAPEQVTGKRLDGRVDIYSLGVILYEMLTGETAFKGDDNVQVLYRHVHGDIKPLHEANPAIPLPLSNIVMRMMAVNPGRRYQSMEEVEDTLRAYRV
ncbi:MAG: HEAT repeat domain-containing protein [Thiotrichales bacterium]